VIVDSANKTNWNGFAIYVVINIPEYYIEVEPKLGVLKVWESLLIPS
jgi:hypothetical protein